MPDEDISPIENTAVVDYEGAQAELEQLVPSWALSFRDTETVAKKAAEWLVEKFPNMFDHSTWVSLQKVDLDNFMVDGEGFRDNGLQVKIYQKQLSKVKKFTLQFGGLFGFKSAGLNISAPVYTTSYGMVVAVGIGVVSPYADFGKDIKPVISFSAKVPLGNLFG